MASKSQKKRGVVLPDPVTGYDLICVRFKIPNHRIYKGAFRAQLERLALSGNWEMSYEPDDRRASEAARMFRKLIDRDLKFGDCDEWDILGDCNMAELRFCTKTNEDGSTTNYYSTNGGCTWHEFEVCEDSWLVTPQDPVDPSDDGGNLPNPSIQQTPCDLATNTFGWIIFNLMYNFIDDCINIPSSTGKQPAAYVYNWMQGVGFGMPQVLLSGFTALALKWYDMGTSLLGFMDNEGSLQAYYICAILPCMTGNIDRTMLNCTKDGFAGYELTNIESGDMAQLTAFMNDFMSIFPVIVAKNRALANEATISTHADCSGCDTPTPTCDIYFPANFENAAIDEIFGFEPVEAGLPANQWSFGEAQFGNRITVAPHRSGDGYIWNNGTNGAGFIQKSWGSGGYGLCDFYSDITNASGRLNTRFSVAWVRRYPSGEWYCIASNIVKIGASGIPNLQWQGMEVVDRLLVGGASGGGFSTIVNIYLNSSLA